MEKKIYSQSLNQPITKRDYQDIYSESSGYLSFYSQSKSIYIIKVLILSIFKDNSIIMCMILINLYQLVFS